MKLNNKIDRRVVAILTMAAAWIMIYYTVTVLKARADTPRMVKEILAEVPLTADDLTPWQLEALLKVQDPGFYSHKGIDLKTPGAGLTTITQSVCKDLYFEAFKPGFRKIKLMLTARYALHPLVSKKDQITLFINVKYMGKRGGKSATGFAEASRLFFDKPFLKLTNEEYLSLVAMIIAPNTFNVITRPEANKERVERIKKVISGEYRPKNLMDQYYGRLSEDVLKDGIAPASYFPGKEH